MGRIKIFFLLTLSLAMGSGAFCMNKKNQVSKEEMEVCNPMETCDLGDFYGKTREIKKLGDLPEELIIEIFQFYYQTPQDLLRIMETCGAFKKTGRKIITNEHGAYTSFERLEIVDKDLMCNKEDRAWFENMHKNFFSINKRQIKTVMLCDLNWCPRDFKRLMNGCVEVEKLQMACCNLSIPPGKKFIFENIYDEKSFKKLKNVVIFIGSLWSKSGGERAFDQYKEIIRGIEGTVKNLTFYHDFRRTLLCHKYIMETSEIKTINEIINVVINFSKQKNNILAKNNFIKLPETTLFIDCSKQTSEYQKYGKIKKVRLHSFDISENKIEELIKKIPETVEKLTINIEKIRLLPITNSCNDKKTICDRIEKILKNEKFGRLKAIKIVHFVYKENKFVRRLSREYQDQISKNKNNPNAIQRIKKHFNPYLSLAYKTLINLEDIIRLRKKFKGKKITYKTKLQSFEDQIFTISFASSNRF